MVQYDVVGCGVVWCGCSSGSVHRILDLLTSQIPELVGHSARK